MIPGAPVEIPRTPATAPGAPDAPGEAPGEAPAAHTLVARSAALAY
jgi:hypothetical protein